MENFQQLIVIAHQAPPQRITQIARLAGFSVQQLAIEQLQAMEPPASGRSLLAYDPAGRKLDRQLSLELNRLQQMGALVLYNVSARQIEPDLALQLGLRGLLARDLPLDQLLLALKAVLAGQLFFPLDVLSRRLDELRHQSGVSADTNVHLLGSMTRQERKIIALVAQGARNKEIADSLNISAHTVKAHMATIFRKSQARSRVDLLRLLRQPATAP